MKKIISILFIILWVTGCGKEGTSKMISVEEAKKMMEKENVVVVDVRTFYEYDQGHIREAINIPLSMIEENNQDMPEKDQIILVYCQSGNRSKQAASKFLELGYNRIYDFGGLENWTGEIEKDV